MILATPAKLITNRYRIWGLSGCRSRLAYSDRPDYVGEYNEIGSC